MGDSIRTLVGVLLIVAFGSLKTLSRLLVRAVVRGWTVGYRAALLGYVVGAVYVIELREALAEAL